MNSKVLISIIIGVCMVAAAGIIAFGMMNSHDTIVVNNTTGTNSTNHANITNNTAVVDHVNHDDTSSQEVSQFQAHDDGFNHYIDDNGNAMVGNPNGQHMSEAQHQYVLAHGMA